MVWEYLASSNASKRGPKQGLLYMEKESGTGRTTYDDNEEADNLGRVSLDIQNERIGDVHGRSKNHDDLHSLFGQHDSHR